MSGLPTNSDQNYASMITSGLIKSSACGTRSSVQASVPAIAGANVPETTTLPLTITCNETGIPASNTLNIAGVFPVPLASTSATNLVSKMSALSSVNNSDVGKTLTISELSTSISLNYENAVVSSSNVNLITVPNSGVCLAVASSGSAITPLNTIPVEGVPVIANSTVGNLSSFSTVPYILVTPPKKIMPRGHRQYRLLKKSPLKSSPVKKVSPLFRQQFRRSLKLKKASSPRKLKFILPKIRPRNRTRVLKAKPSPTKPDNENLKNNRGHVLQQNVSVKSQFVQTEQEPVALNHDLRVDIHESVRKEQSIGQEGSEVENEVEDINTDQQQQLQEEHLMAFLKASSTIAFPRSGERKPHGTSKRPRLNKQQKLLQEKASALSYSPDLKSQEDALVWNYIMKVRNALTRMDPNIFDDFVSMFTNFSVTTDSIENLYFRVCDLLKGFDELKEEFVMFLTANQAIRVGKYPEYCMIMRMREFVDELRHHTARQPQNFQKVLKTLQTLQSRPSISQEEFLEGLTPLLRFQPQLTESLNQILPSNCPIKSLPDDFEDINLAQDDQTVPEDAEVINMIDSEVKTLVENCICECHSLSSCNIPSTQAASQQAKLEHCISCGLRFIDGRVYLQYGKSLRPAKVSYVADKAVDQPVPSQNKVKSSRKIKESNFDKIPKVSSKYNTKKVKSGLADLSDFDEKSKRSRKRKRKYLDSL